MAYVVTAGTKGFGGAGLATPTNPAHVSGDYLFAAFEAQGDQVMDVPPAGWTLIHTDQSGLTGLADKTKLWLYYILAVSGSTTDPTAELVANNRHIVGNVVGVNGVLSFNPANFDVSTKSANSMLLSWPDHTTETDDALTMYFYCIGDSLVEDSAFSGHTSPDLDSITEYFDSSTVFGSDGAVGAAGGLKSSTGVVANSPHCDIETSEEDVAIAISMEVSAGAAGGGASDALMMLMQGGQG